MALQAEFTVAKHDVNKNFFPIISFFVDKTHHYKLLTTTKSDIIIHSGYENRRYYIIAVLQEEFTTEKMTVIKFPSNYIIFASKKHATINCLPRQRVT